jgi:hypothetical protein
MMFNWHIFYARIRGDDKKMENTSSIAYQNKDIASKVFAENFKGKSLKVYGLDVPKVVQVLPTNLPEITANELRIDNLFLLEDGTLAIIDYESDYSEVDKIKYLNYIIRVLSRYEKEWYKNIHIRMIVIYTADVVPEQVNTTLEIGTLTFHIEPAFLSKLDSDEIKQRLTKKVNSGEKLTDEELMEFIILPLTFREREQKQQALRETINLARQITDLRQQTFVLSGTLVFADKIIDTETKQRVKEWIRMTQIGRMFEEEKEEAVREAVEATTKGTVINMLKEGLDTHMIIKLVPSYSLDDVLRLKQETGL